MADKLLSAQRNEITEHHIYSYLAKRTKDNHNRKILEGIADDEMGHYSLCKAASKQDVGPDRLRIFWYTTISRVFGLAFGLKLMERGEGLAAASYEDLRHIPGALKMMKDEKKHEEELLSMISEERVEYAGSIVLGLNDALVELTGALAGLTFILHDPRTIAMTGLITGIAASLSMAASDYLSSKEENAENKNPLKSAFYTGSAYIATVLLLIMPYLLIGNVFISLAIMLSLALLVVFGYTFYITTAKSLPFWKRFLEMALISLCVAMISFGVGYVIKAVLNVDI